MTERENALNTLLRGKPEWIPCRWTAVHQCGHSVMKETGPTDELGRRTGGLDCWGVRWVLTDQGADAPTPDGTQPPLLDDITQWRERVRFPDVEGADWKSGAERELKNFDGTKLLVYFDTEGLFNRLTDLMGFEDAMCALIAEPEEAGELIGAIADHKIRIIEKAARFYKPDVFCYMDDFAASTGPMISPELYRRLFKHHHARIIKAIRENGMIAEQHICGKWDVLMDDFAEIGIQVMFPAQPTNDLRGMQEKYPHMAIVGGADSQGTIFSIHATPEAGTREARRCFEEYATSGRYMFHVSRSGPPNAAHEAFYEEAQRIARKKHV